MKKSSILLIAVALVLSSCGTAAQYTSSDSGQKFQDGIYSSTPSFRSREDKAADKAATDALVEKTKASEIYLLGDKKDTIMIPDNFSARIQYDQKLGGTVITIGENPFDWRYDLENNYGYYYGPYSIGSSWYWSRHYNPWYWSTWTYSPWSYRGWYDPWYAGGWYDPWYYGSYWGYYDPWYHGGWGWNNWYGHHHHPHYCGWYGGWDPHFHGPGHIHDKPGRPGPGHKVLNGQRYQTGSNRVFTTSTSLRGGSTVKGVSGRSSGTISSTSSNRRTTATRAAGTSTIRNGNATSSGGTVTRGTSSSTTSRSAATPANHRKPTVTRNTSSIGSQTSGDSNPSRSGNSQSYQNYQRSSSGSPNRSSYDRSSSLSGPSSFGGGSTRSSSSSGGYSRSGSSGTYRR